MCLCLAVIRVGFHAHPSLSKPASTQNTRLRDIPSKCATRLCTPVARCLPPLPSPVADAFLAKCTPPPAADANIVSTICARNVSLRLTCHNRLPTSNRAWSQRRPPGPLWINGLSRPARRAVDAAAGGQLSRLSLALTLALLCRLRTLRLARHPAPKAVAT